MLIPYINQRQRGEMISCSFISRDFGAEISGAEIKFLWDQALGFWKIHPIPWEPKAFMFSGALPHIFRAKKKHSQLFMVLGSKWFGSMCHENAYWS